MDKILLALLLLLFAPALLSGQSSQVPARIPQSLYQDGTGADAALCTDPWMARALSIYRAGYLLGKVNVILGRPASAAFPRHCLGRAMSS